ncbi:MAG: class I SAM-dependent methyltransferase [Ignavibacteriae bacterium]|nr:class I SAM-dependent methyltransferase [Ignavibacteriota bacterium]
MIDIGDRAGRTTYYFANLVEEYIGIDFSKPIIDQCKKEFLNTPSNISFQY